MKVSKAYAESIRRELTSRMIDRTGQRKGKLVFLYPTTESVICGPTKWIAQCDCGNLSLLKPSELHAQSCGCLRIEKSVPAGVEAKRKLSNDEIRAVRNSLMSAKDCAAVFAVSYETIRNIRSGRCYADVV